MSQTERWEHADLIYTENRHRQFIIYGVDGSVSEVDLGLDDSGMDPRQSESGTLLLARLELAGWELTTPDSVSCDRGLQFQRPIDHSTDI